MAKQIRPAHLRLPSRSTQLTGLRNRSYHIEKRPSLSTRRNFSHMGRRSRRTLRCSPTLACVLAVLSFSLFSWGLSYKLSLYHSHQLPPKMAAAKLLSQKERPAMAQASQIIPPTVPETALNVTRLPYLESSSLTYVPGLELLLRRPRDARLFFTVHTDRKPPPSVAA